MKREIRSQQFMSTIYHYLLHLYNLINTANKHISFMNSLDLDQFTWKFNQHANIRGVQTFAHREYSCPVINPQPENL